MGVPFFPSVPLLTQDEPGVNTAFPPQWGLYNQDGTPVIVSDSVNFVEYARDYNISSYPQEQGAFASYNKVQNPYTSKVGFLVGPSRQEFLDNIEAVAAALTIVQVIVPEITYPSANVVHYNFRRDGQQGVTLIAVDVWVEEVRIVAGAQVSSTAAQQQATGGTNRPIGQSNTLSPGGALTTQSTNAAYPLSTGQVQPIVPVTNSTALATGTGPFAIPQEPPL